MKKIIPLFLTLFLFAACTKDTSIDENSFSDLSASLNVFTHDSNGVPRQGYTVYIYNENAWNIAGDIISNANETKTSDSNGKVTFDNVDYNSTFNSGNQFSNNFHITVHYTIGATSYIKSSEISISRWQRRNLTIVVD